MQSIGTVRWTVSVPACVPASAKARRANLAVSASVVTDYVSFVATFLLFRIKSHPSLTPSLLLSPKSHMAFRGPRIIAFSVTVLYLKIALTIDSAMKL